MTKSEFLCLRKRGYKLVFVNYGEDIKVRVCNSGDATFKESRDSYSARRIKVRKVDYGEDVRLCRTSSYSADFDAV